MLIQKCGNMWQISCDCWSCSIQMHRDVGRCRSMYLHAQACKSIMYVDNEGGRLRMYADACRCTTLDKFTLWDDACSKYVDIWLTANPCTFYSAEALKNECAISGQNHAVGRAPAMHTRTHNPTNAFRPVRLRMNNARFSLHHRSPVPSSLTSAFVFTKLRYFGGGAMTQSIWRQWLIKTMFLVRVP